MGQPNSSTIKGYYYLKDHLGSIRAVVDEAGNIVSSDDYDPWGMILNGRSTNTAYINAKYKFSGKELDTETGYFHFGARPYDGRIGRWNVIDPLDSQRPGLSPYNYCQNNPITLIDPTGMLDTRLEFDEKGNIKNIVDDGKTEITGAIVNNEDRILQSFTFNDALDAQALMNLFNNPSNLQVTKNTDKIYLTGLDINFETEEMIGNIVKGVSNIISANSNYFLKLGATTMASKRYGGMDYASQMSNYDKLKIINGVAYNHFDAGNYMWGMSMKILGYTYLETKISSNIHSRVVDGHWDSGPDQKAIYNGFYMR